MKITPYEETHQQGTITFENREMFSRVIQGDFGIQIAEDGRVWICINGIAAIRFSPHLDGKMSPT